MGEQQHINPRCELSVSLSQLFEVLNAGTRPQTYLFSSPFYQSSQNMTPASSVTDIEKAPGAAARDLAQVEGNKKVEQTDLSQRSSAVDGFLVELDPEEDPKNLPAWKKWQIILVICFGALCTTCASSMVRSLSSHL